MESDTQEPHTLHRHNYVSPPHTNAAPRTQSSYQWIKVTIDGGRLLILAVAQGQPPPALLAHPGPRDTGMTTGSEDDHSHPVLEREEPSSWSALRSREDRPRKERKDFPGERAGDQRQEAGGPERSRAWWKGQSHPGAQTDPWPKSHLSLPHPQRPGSLGPRGGTHGCRRRTAGPVPPGSS